ncbi:MAG: hypothetical protein R2932_60240 [Caldilineaceae bacterium]
MGAGGSSIANREIGEIRVPAFKTTVVDRPAVAIPIAPALLWALPKDGVWPRPGGWGRLAALVITGLGSDAGIVDLAQTINFMNTAEILSV